MAEERGQAPEVLLAPLADMGVDVALGALDLDAHEQVADRAGQFFRGRLVVILVGQEEKGGRRLVFLALGREQGADDLVPARALVELAGEPGC